MLTTFKSIRLEDDDSLDDARCASHWDGFLSSVGRLMARVGGCFVPCWSRRKARGEHCTDGRDEVEDGESEEDERQILLDGRPIRFDGGRRFSPTHAASSFLRTGTSAGMREANSIL
ncbi:hypothetical protein E4U19_006141 [Claviceps sp. Clav32 group G5]|nr:hypothetical protein E4U19_006141 [Claviceps sp. Clav32 group G5]KAG6051852.1 hypothetical protein E4U39_006940 [Claviceps sp. Clav50 group G5]